MAGAAILAAVAAAPDLDLIIHNHRGPTHSVGAALIAGAVAWIVASSAFAKVSADESASAAAPSPPSPRPRRTSRRDARSWAVAVTLAWASHVLLDWLSHDTRPPLGVMALWPFTHDYYKAAVEVFPAISRRYWLAEFWIYNLEALAVESIVLGPVAAVAVWWRSGRPHQ
jgi:membrane-bound metal-dependent hydrolase YbcI (DUF457 family)